MSLFPIECEPFRQSEQIKPRRPFQLFGPALMYTPAQPACHNFEVANPLPPHHSTTTLHRLQSPHMPDQSLSHTSLPRRV